MEINSSMIKSLRATFGTRLLSGASGMAAVKVAGAGVVFVVQVFLARLLGVVGYGQYAYAMAWAMILSVPAGLGLSPFVTREVAYAHAQNDWGRVHGLVRWSRRAIVVGWGVTAAASVAVILMVFGTKASITGVFVAAIFFIFADQQTGLLSAAITGLGFPVQGAVPAGVVRPAVFLVLLFAVSAAPVATSPAMAISLNLAAVCVAFSINGRILSKRLPTASADVSMSIAPLDWVRWVFPFMMISGMYLINARADVAMLGAISGPRSAGVYEAATRGAVLVSFPLMALHAPLTSLIAEHWAKGEILRIEREIVQALRPIAIVSVVGAIVLIIGRSYYFALFGKQFQAGGGALVLLCVGQAVNVMFGPVGIVLNMTGHERLTAMGVGFSAVLNVGLNAILIPRYGMTGAAVATLTSLILWNVLLTYWVWKRVGIQPQVWRLRHRNFSAL